MPNYTLCQTGNTPGLHTAYFYDSSEKAPRLYCCRLSFPKVESRRRTRTRNRAEQSADHQQKGSRLRVEDGRKNEIVFQTRTRTNTRFFVAKLFFNSQRVRLKCRAAGCLVISYAAVVKLGAKCKSAFFFAVLFSFLLHLNVRQICRLSCA